MFQRCLLLAAGIFCIVMNVMLWRMDASAIRRTFKLVNEEDRHYSLVKQRYSFNAVYEEVDAVRWLISPRKFSPCVYIHLTVTDLKTGQRPGNLTTTTRFLPNTDRWIE